jgi:ribosomal protein S18 acetylase RimI-like enzyme
VDVAHRRVGHGKRLLEYAADAARQLGATSLELWVWDFNHGALALYERCGYRGLDRRLSKPL